MNNPREIVKFNGAPVVVTLTFAKGKPASNEHGDFFTYSAEGNRVFFANAALNSAIQGQTPEKGTRLSISRSEAGWDVRRVDPPAEQPGTPPSPVAPRAAMHTPGDDSSVPTQVQYGAAFADFLILAADAVRSAERNSPAGSVRFDNRDVAAIATTMWIAAQKQGFLTWNGAAQGGR